MADAYREISNSLIYGSKNGYFIKDSVMEAYLNKIAFHLQAANKGTTKTNRVLINRTPFVNTESYGNGMVSLTLGLLSKNPSEGELAFLIAREMAHYHLNHTHETISLNLKVNYDLERIYRGNMNLADLECIQSWEEKVHNDRKEKNIRADSLAYLWTKNAGYSHQDAIGALLLVKNGFQPDSPLNKELFDYFLFDEFPFKKRWLQPQAKDLTQPYDFPFFNDSPYFTSEQMDKRIDLIAAHAPDILPHDQTKERRDFLGSCLEQELIHAAHASNHLDYALHLALQLKKKDPESKFANFAIGRLLFELAEKKVNDKVDPYQQDYFEYYSNETKALSCFLNNLSAGELSELAYWFTIKTGNFNYPNHHRLLYKICFFTRRFEERKKIRNDFRLRFPNASIAKYQWDEQEVLFKPSLVKVSNK